MVTYPNSLRNSLLILLGTTVKSNTPQSNTTLIQLYELPSISVFVDMIVCFLLLRSYWVYIYITQRIC